MKEIIITTTDSRLAADLESFSLEGLTIKNKVRQGKAFITTCPTDPGSVIETIINVSAVALSPLLKWLSDRRKNKPSDTIHINGIEVSGNNAQIKIIINKITNNYNNCDKIE